MRLWGGWRRTGGLLAALLSMGLLLLPALPVQAGFAVEMTPARLELKVDAGKTTRSAVKLRTRERMVQKVEVRTGYFSLNNEGSPVFDNPKDMSQSAAAWITASSPEFKINPNQDKLLRLEVNVPPVTPPGGYRAAVFIAPPKEDTKSKKEGANVFLVGQLALLVYVTVGGATADGVVKSWEWKQIPPAKSEGLAFQVTNQGTAHLRLAGIAEVKDSQGKKFDAVVPGVPVLQGQTRWVPLEFVEGTPALKSAVDIDATIDLGRGEKRINAHVGERK